MIYDCDPADTISALRAANEDLSEQVRYWKDLANKPDGAFQFQLRTAKSELEIACAEINRLNEVIEKYRAASPQPAPDSMRERIDAYRQHGGKLFSGFTVADDFEAALSAPVPSSDRPDYESAAWALGFIRTPTGNWIHPKDDFTLRRHYTSAEEIFNRELSESGS